MKEAASQESSSATPADAERSLLADLLELSRLYHTSKDYLELLDFASRLRNFAPFNAMLLQIQRPGLTYAASEYDWQTRFNRTIKEDARPPCIRNTARMIVISKSRGRRKLHGLGFGRD